MQPPRLVSLGTPANLRVLQNYGIAGSVLTVAALYERRFSQNQQSTGGHRPPLQQTKTALRQFCNTLNLGEELLFLTPRTGKRLDDGVSETRICKFGLIADALSRCGKQPRRERFVPSISEPRNVSENFRDLFLRYIAWQRKCVHSSCADRGIRENRIKREGSFGPALCQDIVFHDRDHQARVACSLHGSRLHRASDDS